MKEPVINMVDTGVNIRSLRKEKALTVKALSEILGLRSTQAIYAWEAGKSVPTVDHLILLCNIFDVAFEELVVRDWVEFKKGDV